MHAQIRTNFLNKQYLLVALTAMMLLCRAFSADDIAVKREDLQWEARISKHFLHLPVKNDAPMRLMNLIVDGKIKRELMIELADGGADFWVYLDAGEFIGKTATLRTKQLPGDNPAILEQIVQDNKPVNDPSLYRERLRPQFHFSSRRGWLNDPNGMVYYKGQYHLFYQHNPYGWSWGNMTWGHAVSPDMVHWTELPDALHPDELGTMFSGSAVIDYNNTAGFKTGDEAPLVCVYTTAGGSNAMSKGKRFTQSLAYSNDNGRSWVKYAGNPVLGHVQRRNRDPKVFWHLPTERWVMALYLDNDEMGFYTSRDLKSWEFGSRLKCFHECPELFELPVDGDLQRKKWVLYGASGEYFIGRFDGREFKPETESLVFDRGDCFYASQTFNNIPRGDGRRLQIAWGRIDIKRMSFNQQMLFPVELSLRTTGEGVRMCANPVKEIASLYDKEHAWSNQAIVPGKNLRIGIAADLLDIEATLHIGQASSLGFKIRDIEVIYDAAKQQLICKKKTAPVKAIGGYVELRLLVDRTSIEIFANGGNVYMPMSAVPGAYANNAIELYAKGGNARVVSMQVRKLHSAW
jgi:fructan beta-fructosidase